MNIRITPIRKIKEGNKGTIYEAKTACGKLTMIIADGDDGYPVRFTAQSTGGGCEGNLEGMQRLVTLLLELNTRADCIIEQLNKVICPACKSKMLKGEKDIALSCSKAIARALEKHIYNGQRPDAISK